MILELGATILLIKTYLAAHGATIATHIIIAAIKAAFLGQCVKTADLAAEATEAAADLLENFLKNLFNQ